MVGGIHVRVTWTHSFFIVTLQILCYNVMPIHLGKKKALKVYIFTQIRQAWYFEHHWTVLYQVKIMSHLLHWALSGLGIGPITNLVQKTIIITPIVIWFRNNALFWYIFKNKYFNFFSNSTKMEITYWL